MTVDDLGQGLVGPSGLGDRPSRARLRLHPFSRQGEDRDLDAVAIHRREPLLGDVQEGGQDPTAGRRAHPG